MPPAELWRQFTEAFDFELAKVWAVTSTDLCDVPPVALVSSVRPGGNMFSRPFCGVTPSIRALIVHVGEMTRQAAIEIAAGLDWQPTPRQASDLEALQTTVVKWLALSVQVVYPRIDEGLSFAKPRHRGRPELVRSDDATISDLARWCEQAIVSDANERLEREMREIRVRGADGTSGDVIAAISALYLRMGRRPKQCEVAEHLGVEERTARRWLASSGLTYPAAVRQVISKYRD